MGKAAEGERNLSYQGITFVTLDGASRLLNTSCDIAEVGQLLFPILVGWVPPFEETLDWLHFVYTADRTGDYMAPASTVLVPSQCWKNTLSFPRSGGTSCAASQEHTLRLQLHVTPSGLTT